MTNERMYMMYKHVKMYMYDVITCMYYNVPEMGEHVNVLLILLSIYKCI
jgi:hypothetical protein